MFNYEGQLYAIVGAQNLENPGFIKLYKADDNNMETWGSCLILAALVQNTTIELII